MRELVWNEGMSVGIDAIDEDHKQIIAILAKLTSTDSEKISKQNIDEIFSELEEYVLLHFEREEALLEKANYKDFDNHKKSHQKFANQLPVLKKQWLQKDTLACSDKIITFLHHWIINHILEEDFDYVPTLHNSSDFSLNQLNENDVNYSKVSLLSKISTVLSEKVKLSKRVFITTFIPICGVLLLSLIVIQDNYQHYKNMALLSGLNNVIIQVNDISHSLQAERGLSSGLTSSNYQQYKQSLLKRRQITDQDISKFLILLNNKIDPSVKDNIQLYSDHVRQSLKELVTHREHVDTKNVSFQETYQAYTALIEKLLSISENLTHLEMNSQLSSNISAISSILVFKEYMGQVRAIGMNMVGGNENDLYSNLEVSLLVGKQLNALHVFNYTANNQQKILCSDYCDENLHVKMLELEFTRIMNRYDSNERGKQWFGLMSVKINELKRLTDSLTLNFKHILLAESEAAKRNYLVTLTVLSAFLFTVILFTSILSFSIIYPIRRVTDALHNMAKGHRNIHFKNLMNDDEIGAIELAYEKLRRRLLQIDIFKAVVDSQKEEISYRKSQQEHFEVLAFTDALTGAVNRHQFNKVLGDEIAQANFNQQTLSILLIDIDYFKKINDSFGHGVGDEVLIMFYKACKNEARNDDVVARIGGEEFVIVLPKTSAKSAYQFAERLREKIQNLDIIIDDNEINFTVSIGVSEWNSELFSCPEAFVADADKSLYQAKEQGRNKVVGNLLEFVSVN